jgi:hypothetical protein
LRESNDSGVLVRPSASVRAVPVVIEGEAAELGDDGDGA